jgi:alcohol dehydrogenase class IV
VVVASGLNALAHCVDSLWAPRSDPINAVLAQEGAGAVAGGLRAEAAASGDVGTRERMQYGAYLAAVAFASAGAGLHHKICHVLGGAYGLPHAPTHAVVLPYVAALNLPAAPQAEQRLRAALEAHDALAGLELLRRDLHAPRSLAEVGLERSAIPEAARLVLEAAPPGNPRPLDEAVITELLEAAWAGRAPEEVSRA